jgi:hypothetical protein
LITNNTSFHVASVSKAIYSSCYFAIRNWGRFIRWWYTKVYLKCKIKKHIYSESPSSYKTAKRSVRFVKTCWLAFRRHRYKTDVLNLIYNQKELNFMPNQEFMYSNSGYTLLAEIVSKFLICLLLSLQKNLSAS